MRIIEIINEDVKFNDKVLALIQKVKSGQMTSIELLQLKKNVETKPGTEDLVKEIETYLRMHDPRSASREYGRKDKDVSEKLKSIDDYIIEKYKLNNSVLRTGIKPGGDMTGGRKYLDYYIGYKSPEGLKASLALLQDTFESEIRWHVSLDIVNRDYGNSQRIDEEWFAYKDEHSAIEAYESYIKEVIGSLKEGLRKYK
jgi:hypothetical protein